MTGHTCSLKNNLYKNNKLSADLKFHWGDKMKKLLLSLTIVSAMGLSGCGDETISDVVKENNETGPVAVTSKVVFDPAAGLLSYPNDLLFSGTIDGTLNIPVDDATDFSNPLVAANALDGWSTHQPFSLAIDFADGVSLDANSVTPSAVIMFEAEMGGSLTDADCAAVAQGLGCKALTQLVFGVDFVAQASGDNIIIVPLKPLKAKRTYILALTNSLMDSEGVAVAESSTYELIQQDIATLPLVDATQLQLQALVNSFENLTETYGALKEDVIYTMAMTTQSISDVLNVTKQLVANPLSPIAPNVAVGSAGYNAATALGLDSTHAQYALFASANVYGGTLNNVPYYSGVPTVDNPTAPINQPWKAACDSGALLVGLTASNPELIAAAAAAPGVNDAYCQNFGLRDLGLDAERNLTKFNPIPQMVELQNIDIIMTIPEINTANAVRASLGMEVMEMPEAGWPVVMLQHGITGTKEQMLALSGVLSINGFATASIDHALHGSRGYGAINASSNPTAYLNLASLLNGRDNLRQSVADSFAMRMGLNNVLGADINGLDVYYTGLSLGSITGNNFIALTNTSLGNPVVDAMFKVNGAVLSVPGGGIGNFLFNSPSFSNLVKASLAYAGSEDFKNFADAQLGDAVADPSQLAMLWPVFEANLTEEQLAGLNAVFAQFAFAAQSIVDSGDPINYASMVTESGSNVLVTSVVGNGGDNLEDQVIPTTASQFGSQVSGSGPLIDLLGLDIISGEVFDEEGVSAAVKFVNGHHGSLLDPSIREGVSPDTALSARATLEMQTQLAIFFGSKGTYIKVSDPDVVLK